MRIKAEFPLPWERVRVRENKKPADMSAGFMLV
jgi:hypothetical protein